MLPAQEFETTVALLAKHISNPHDVGTSVMDLDKRILILVVNEIAHRAPDGETDIGTRGAFGGDARTVHLVDPARRAWVLLTSLEQKVCNGGLGSFFCERLSEAPFVVEALKSTRCSKASDAFQSFLDPIGSQTPVGPDPDWQMVKRVLAENKARSDALERWIFRADWERIRLEHATRHRRLFFR